MSPQDGTRRNDCYLHTKDRQVRKQDNQRVLPSGARVFSDVRYQLSGT